MEIDTDVADARLVTLPRCPECLFSVVLYAPIKLHAQRVLASNVIGTLVTEGGGRKKIQEKKKDKGRGKKKKEGELSGGKNSAICTVDPFIPQIRIGFTF